MKFLADILLTKGSGLILEDAGDQASLRIDSTKVVLTTPTARDYVVSPEGVERFRVKNTSYGIVVSSHVVPVANNTHDLGSTSLRFRASYVVTGDFSGQVTIGSIPHMVSATGNVLVGNSGVVSYRTTGEILSDIGAVSLTGSYSNPSWITSLAWSKITGTPTTRDGYGITDVPKTDGTGASGNWSINITGNAATATLAANSTLWASNPYSGSDAAISTYMLAWNGSAWFPASSSRIKTFLGYYTSGDSPTFNTLTLSGLSGTGNRIAYFNSSGGFVRSVIDPSNIVTTDGSYSNPTWITSLAWSKLTGVPNLVYSDGTGSTNVVLEAASTANLNSIGVTGIWSSEYTGSTNRPISAGGHAWQISDAGSPTDVVTQWYTTNTTNNPLYYRLQWGNSNWGSWVLVLTNYNYNSYAPSLTGAGASGNWSINAATATLASTVTINYNNDSNSTYQMLWGSGTSIYGTAGVYINPFTDTVYASNFIGNWNGYSYAIAGSASTMVLRDSSGYINGTFINMSDNSPSAGAGQNVGTATAIIVKAGDNYYRSSTAPGVAAFLGLGSMAYASTGSYLPIVGGNLTTYDVTTSTGQGRFGGWYQGGGYTGLAVEAGVSGGNGNVICYNRSAGSYSTLSIAATTISLNSLSGETISNSQGLRFAPGGSSTPYIRLEPGSYGASYNTVLGALAGAPTILQMGNNGPNYIVGGTTLAGGSIYFNVNNTANFPSSPNGTNALILNSNASANFNNSVTASNFIGNLNGYNDYISREGGSYYKQKYWLEINVAAYGNVGLYWSNVSNITGGYAEIYSNNIAGTGYGAVVVEGIRSSYGGIGIAPNGGGPVGYIGMFDGSGNGGDYDISSGWHFYWNISHACLGIGGSTTYSGYKGVTNGNHYVTGYLYTPTVYYGTNILYNANTSFGIVGPNAYFDTVNGTGSDSLELNYYSGGQVICGVGTTAGYISQSYSGTKNIGAAQVIANNGFKSVNAYGMVGDYDANGTASKIVWTIGDQWNSIASYYGIGYSYSAMLGQHEINMAGSGTRTHYFGLNDGRFFHAGTGIIQGNSTGLAIRSGSYNIGHIGGAYSSGDWSAASGGGDFVVARNGTSGYSGTHLILSNQNNGYIKFAFGSSSTTPDDTVKAYFTTDGWLYAYHFSETSDRRYKVERDANPSFKGVEKLSARLYEKNGRLEVGYYAQDVLELGIIDHAVSKDLNGVYALSYTEVHTAKIARLEERVAELEKQVERLGGNL